MAFDMEITPRMVSREHGGVQQASGGSLGGVAGFAGSSTRVLEVPAALGFLKLKVTTAIEAFKELSVQASTAMRPLEDTNPAPEAPPPNWSCPLALELRAVAIAVDDLARELRETKRRLEI